jgi:hypothetical protein
MYERPNFIPFDDGYTLPGFIKAVEGLHGSLRFSYRPTPTLVRSSWLKALENVDDEQYEQRTATILARKIVSWDFVDLEHKPVPITMEGALHLQPTIFRKLEGIVLGTLPTDIDPQWTESQKKESADNALDAVLRGCDPATLVQTKDEKNSAAG